MAKDQANQALVPAQPETQPEVVKRRRVNPNKRYVEIVAPPNGGEMLVLKPAGIELVKYMAREGLALETMANKLGMSPWTFAALRKRQPEIDDVIGEGRALLSDELQCLLMERARGGDLTAMIFLAKSRAGWSDRGDKPIEGTNAPKVVNNTQVNITLAEPLTEDQLIRLTRPQHDPD
ncbi:MAG: hypothetical protein KJ622_03705 [Alphaproteobacteria bacterium]|nr:hypothetical protein [Alphaproteobacteria bacterium]